MGSRVVVITGASGGLGRAIARGFGARGDHVALLARGRDRLDATADEITAAGGAALVLPTDVAHSDAVADAGRRVEDELGPIDVWVNSAMTSVFAPFAAIDADEFARVTAVNYLGFVHGTMTALHHMRPRDRGTIVQVGSALAYRSIPLQSAYCGSKHAILGFTESVRTELLHDRSGVRITMVQMPGMNTPQFSWVRAKLPGHPQPVAPIYQPEVGARAVLYAADHPNRHNYYVGMSTSLTVLGNKVAPGVLDRYLAVTNYRAQQMPAPPAPTNAAGNLFDPVPGDFGAHGIFDDDAKSRSAQFWASTHKAWLALSAGTLAGAGALLLRRARR
jgi:NAD(P)-dependent dehydrogenase (short-subunit alcohol dehydrogenase family)